MKWFPALVAAAVTTAPAAASFASTQSFRLAFSKAENIEIFVDHAGRDEWCAPVLKLRAVHGGEPNQQALAGLLPKLGALLDQQCPQASSVEWTSTTAEGRPVASGTSSKADRWALRTESPKATVAAAPETPAPVPASPPTAADGPAATPEAGPPSTPPVAVAPARPEAAAPAAAEAAAPAAAEAAAPAAAEAAAPPAAEAAAPAAAEAVAPAPPPAAVAPAAPTAVEPQRRAAAAPTTIGDFEINGWKPLDVAAAKAQAGFLQVLQDQNGCRILTTLDRDDAASLTLRSEGLQCGPDGYASGKGQLNLDRSDGVRVGRTGALWFVAGIPFTQPLGPAQLAGTGDQRELWWFLGSDAESKSHFLLRAKQNRRNGLGVWVPEPRIDAITGDESRFRQAESIEAAIEAALAAFDRNGMPDARWVTVVFSSDFSKVAAPARDRDHLVYEIQPARQSVRRGADGPGRWQINLQRATNHLFQRDARIAQQKRLEEQRAAQQRLFEEQRAAQQRLLEEQREAQRRRVALMEKVGIERRKLQTYQSFVDAAANPKLLLSRVESDLDYTPGSGGSYARALTGGTHSISRIVRVSGRDGDDASVDHPYEMRLIGQRELKAGWYLVKGTVAFDEKRRDREELPLTLVTPGVGALHECRQDGCADLLDPLALTRFTLGEPDWTPEAATAVIESVR